MKTNEIYYTSIEELPMACWDVINRTGDFSYLLKGSIKRLPKRVYAENIWSQIYDEYIDLYGLSQELIEAMRLKSKAARLRMESYCNDNSEYKITLAEHADMEAGIKLESLQGGNLTETTVIIEKHMGFLVDPWTTPVTKYMAYLDNIKKDVQQKKHG